MEKLSKRKQIRIGKILSQSLEKTSQEKVPRGKFSGFTVQFVMSESATEIRDSILEPQNYRLMYYACQCLRLTIFQMKFGSTVYG